MLDHIIFYVRQLFSIAIFAALWHLAVFLLGTRRGESMFDETRKRYQPFGWEQDGKWYQRRLRIKSWKDKLPQRVPDGGFSKEHLDGVTVAYLDRFILETCRGEWIHFSNFLLAGVLLLFVSGPLKIPCALAIALLHLPYVAIQRYNRFRLVRYRDRLARPIVRVADSQASVS